MRWRREAGFVTSPSVNRERYQRTGRCVTLQRKYGITEQDYTRLYKLQGGKCRVCDKFLRVLHVDHDHVTQRIRGLLCGKCNRGVGMFDDDPFLLAAAADYLGARLDT